jgi:uncharacterized protein
MRIRSKMAAALAVAGALAFTQDAFAQDYPTPSFDCANVMSPQELQICRSQELSELDGRHGSLVERAIRTSPNRDETRAEMDAWLERVRNPCQTDSCLVDAYTSHIRELERIVPAVMPQPAFTAPARRDLATAAKAAPEPVKPAAVKTAPPPEPVGADDDDGEDEDESPGSAIVIALAALALAVWLVFRAARRTPVNATGERDASGDRP